ncbi:MAG TPA: hypothetical protein VIR34_12855 [Gemmatimonadaceae bacterium]|jgi:hypothetical protein
MRRFVIKRSFVALAGIIVIGVFACDSSSVAGPAAGSYGLSAVLSDTGNPTPVPATLPRYGDGDTLHVLGGAFTLGPERSWHWQRTAELIHFEERVPQELELSGHYTARGQGDGVMLDLYPGQPILANIPGSAFIRHDSLFYGAGIFTRAR